MTGHVTSHQKAFGAWLLASAVLSIVFITYTLDKNPWAQVQRSMKVVPPVPKHMFTPYSKTSDTRMGKNDNSVSPNLKPPVILFWTPFFGDKDWGMPTGTKPMLPPCRSTCDYTTDKNRFKDSAAIIIHPRDNVPPLPGFRQKWQRVVFFLLESPVHTPSLKQFNGMFNWTMTYRRDSDTYTPFYGESVENTSHVVPADRNHADGKTNLIFWLVSNCHTPSKRELYVTELNKHIKVDKYGGCGKKCPNCQDIAKTYKFYLAFENSLCQGYATEKLYQKGYGWGLVPVVYGGANYSDFLPPNSYINVADFKSPKELAGYLKKLASNDTLYNTFFEWRKSYVIRSDQTMSKGFCSLCTKLVHNESIHANVYQDLHAWWFKDTCLPPEKRYPLLKNIFRT